MAQTFSRTPSNPCLFCELSKVLPSVLQLLSSLPGPDLPGAPCLPPTPVTFSRYLHRLLSPPSPLLHLPLLTSYAQTYLESLKDPVPDPLLAPLYVDDFLHLSMLDNAAPLLPGGGGDPLLAHHLRASALALAKSLTCLRPSGSEKATADSSRASDRLTASLLKSLTPGLLFPPPPSSPPPELSEISRLLLTSLPYTSPPSSGLETPSPALQAASATLRANLADLLVACLQCNPHRVVPAVSAFLDLPLAKHACRAVDALLEAAKTEEKIDVVLSVKRAEWSLRLAALAGRKGAEGEDCVETAGKLHEGGAEFEKVYSECSALREILDAVKAAAK